MLIKSLKLTRFKKFKSLDLDFAPGLNIIKGPNEQGKSTLVLALIAGLFYDPKKNNELIRKNRSWGEEKLYRILMELEHEGNKYELEKDFEDKVLVLKNEETGEVLETYADISNKIADLSGLSTPNLFETTACIRQDKIAELSSGKKELEKALQDVVTSGKEGVFVTDVLKNIEKIVASLKRGLDRPTINPGNIKKLQDECASKEGELFALRDKLSEVSKQEEGIKKLTLLKEEIEKEGKIKRKLVESNRKIFEVDSQLKQYLKSLDEIEEKLTKLQELLREHRELESKLSEFSSLSPREIEKAEEELVKLKSTLESMKEDLKAGKEREVKDLKKRKNMVYIGAAVFAIVGILGFFVHWSLLVGFLVALGLVIYSFQSRDGSKSSSFDIEKANKLKNKRQELLKKLEVENLDELREKKERFFKIRNAESEKKAEIKGVTSGKSKEDFEEEKKRIAREVAILEAKKEELGVAKSLTPEEFQRLEEEIKQLERKYLDTSQELATAEALVKSSEGDRDALIKLEEEVPELKEQLEREIKRLKVYEVTYQHLLAAKNKVSMSAKERLQTDINVYLPHITEGKYKNIVVDDNLAFEMESEVVGEKIKPEGHLSRGTVDQLYLAARFSLVKLMSEQKKPPMILDDPLVTFDQIRTSKAMELIKSFSEEFQIFFFTYSDDYDQWGDLVVVL